MDVTIPDAEAGELLSLVFRECPLLGNPAMLACPGSQKVMFLQQIVNAARLIEASASHGPGAYSLDVSDNPVPITENEFNTFFESLPLDRFLPWEDELIDSLEKCTYRQKRGSGSKYAKKPKLLSQFQEHPKSAPVIAQWLPSSVSLKDWITKRASNMFELVANESQELEIHAKTPKTEEEKLQWKADRAARLECFFEHLPVDSFTPEESDLRDAVLKALTEWCGTSPMNMCQLQEYATIREAKRLVINCGVGISMREFSFYEWLLRRLGEEVDMRKDESDTQPNWHQRVPVGLCGQIDMTTGLWKTQSPIKRRKIPESDL